MQIKEFIEELKSVDACGAALMEIRHYKTAQEWWDDAGRGDWMLWLIGKKAGEPWSDKRKKLVLTSCKCARLVWDLMLQPSKDCIELFERWGNGEDIPVEDLEKVRRACAAYAADAAAYAAAAAAYAAYAAAYAADAAAYAADAAAYAAYAAADAADAYAAARTETLAKCAEIVRKDYPNIDAFLTP